MPYDKLKELYTSDETIFIHELMSLGFSYDNLCQQLKILVDKGFLKHYSDGVYYFA